MGEVELVFEVRLRGPCGDDRRGSNRKAEGGARGSRIAESSKARRQGVVAAGRRHAGRNRPGGGRGGDRVRARMIHLAVEKVVHPDDDEIIGPEIGHGIPLNGEGLAGIRGL